MAQIIRKNDDQWKRAEIAVIAEVGSRIRATPMLHRVPIHPVTHMPTYLGSLLKEGTPQNMKQIVKIFMEKTTIEGRQTENAVIAEVGSCTRATHVLRRVSTHPIIHLPSHTGIILEGGDVARYGTDSAGIFGENDDRGKAD